MVWSRVSILLPYCSFQAHTLSKNFSRPRSKRVRPSSRSFSSTFNLGGDSRVVGAREPECGKAFHALIADKRVLNCVVKCVAPGGAVPSRLEAVLQL